MKNVPSLPRGRIYRGKKLAGKLYNHKVKIQKMLPSWVNIVCLKMPYVYTLT